MTFSQRSDVMNRPVHFVAFTTIVLVTVAPLLAAEKRPAPSGPPAWSDPDRSEPAGTHYRTFKSQLAHGEVSYLVYLPPDYESNATRRYPVVYWLHGYGGNPRAGAAFVKPLDAAIRVGKRWLRAS